MSSMWMLYGVTGYTGRLLLAEAVRRGHRPVIAGRSAEKIRPLAEQYGVPWCAFGLDDVAAIVQQLRDHDVKAVFHAAGPFIHTSQPMIEACLQAQAHYLDITGEIPVYEHLFRQDDRAQTAGVALISGVGFDVVPSDCALKYVADQLTNPTHLDLAIKAFSAEKGQAHISAGTFKSMLEMLPKGTFLRQDGQLVPQPLGQTIQSFTFSDGASVQAMPIPWGDLVTAYQATSVPNIGVYMALAPSQIKLLRYGDAFVRGLLALNPIRKGLGSLASRFIEGPNQTIRDTSQAYIYARARNAEGDTAEVWLETIEGYQFTAYVGLLALERLLAGDHRGALSPAMAFGVDFVLEVEGSARYDALPT